MSPTLLTCVGAVGNKSSTAGNGRADFRLWEAGFVGVALAEWGRGSDSLRNNALF